MISCKNHPEREAAGMCIACGKPFCEDCLVDVKDKYFCKIGIAERLRRIEERRKAEEEEEEEEEERELQQTQPDPKPARVIVENIPAHPAKKKSTALLLWLFLGGIGAHRYYTGHTLTGFLLTSLYVVNTFLSWSTWILFFSEHSFDVLGEMSGVSLFLTFLIGIWMFYDFVMIVSNTFTDEYGNSLM